MMDNMIIVMREALKKQKRYKQLDFIKTDAEPKSKYN